MTFVSDRPTKPSLHLPPKPIAFDAFIDWYPELSEFHYELRRGVIIEMPKPKGKHSAIGGEIVKKLNTAIDAAAFSYFIPRECLVKVTDDTGYEPDVIVLDQKMIETEARWENDSTIENNTSIKLIVEVVSTNWQDDYEFKMADYESMGISEYWIVDYLGLGGIRHIGKPKQPTFTVCTLVDGEYETQMFRDDETIVSSMFPDLTVTAAEILGY